MKITPNYQMNLNSINNNRNQKMQKTNPQFRALFSKEQLKEMTKNPQFGEYINMREYLPRLAALLDYLSWIHGGALAKWNVEEGTITINGTELKPNTAHKKYDAVDDFLTDQPHKPEDFLKCEGKKDIVSILENLLVEQDGAESYWCGSEEMPLQYARLPKSIYELMRCRYFSIIESDITSGFHIGKPYSDYSGRRNPSEQLQYMLGLKKSE